MDKTDSGRLYNLLSDTKRTEHWEKYKQTNTNTFLLSTVFYLLTTRGRRNMEWGCDQSITLCLCYSAVNSLPLLLVGSLLCNPVFPVPILCGLPIGCISSGTAPALHHRQTLPQPSCHTVSCSPQAAAPTWGCSYRGCPEPPTDTSSAALWAPSWLHLEICFLWCLLLHGPLPGFRELLHCTWSSSYPLSALTLVPGRMFSVIQSSLQLLCAAVFPFVKSALLEAPTAFLLA